jgi:hypothetical protein
MRFAGGLGEMDSAAHYRACLVAFAVGLGAAILYCVASAVWPELGAAP